MLPYRRMLVVLDKRDDDQDLIRYAEFCSKIYRPEDIYFVYVTPDLESQLDFTVRFQDEGTLAMPVDEEIAASVRQRVKRYFGDLGQTRIHIDVLEGKQEAQVTHWAAVKHADLVLLGRHGDDAEETVNIKRIVRRVNASILVVPTGAEPAVQSVVVPVDFSEQSALALYRAQQLAERLDEVDLRLFHAFEVPPGHFRISRSAEQFERIMADNANEAMERFLERADAGALSEAVVLAPVTGSNPATDIQKHLAQEAADLVVIGAQGHGAVERFLVGSVTESLLERCANQAVLVIKD
jgi:nucleotide-binding universal stress UspA family protein